MTQEVALAKLPDIRTAKLPDTYLAAKDALSQCSRVDECKEWANKAMALASYAKQSEDKSLFNLAVKIQARAIRRCGQLLKEVEPKDRGGDRRSPGRCRPGGRTQAAQDAGLSERQKKTALRVATVPEETFEAEVESDNPPSVTKLAQMGIVSKENYHPSFSKVVSLGGTLGRLAEFCDQNDPNDLVGAIKEHYLAEFCLNIATIEEWLQRFAKSLSKEFPECIQKQ